MAIRSQIISLASGNIPSDNGWLKIQVDDEDGARIHR